MFYRFHLLFLLSLYGHLAISQGLHYSLDLHDDVDFLQTHIVSIKTGPGSEELSLFSNQLYKTHRAIGFSTFSSEQGILVENYLAPYDYLNLEAKIPLNDSIVALRISPGQFDLRAEWVFIDLNAKKETFISPVSYSLTDPFYKGDSVFLICSKKEIDPNRFGGVVDSERGAYLTYLNLADGSLHYLDSLIYPMDPRFGALRYNLKLSAWQITQDSLRILFKNGQVQDQFVDSNLLQEAFGIRNSFYTRQVRNTYFRKGRQATFKDTLGHRLLHIWYNEVDTIKYLFDFEGAFKGQELNNLQGLGYLVSLKPRKDGIMDWMRYLPDGNIQLHRIEPNDGAHFVQYFNKEDFPGYSILCMWSMSDGSFYLGGTEKRTNSKSKALLIRVDSSGNHYQYLGENRFQLHYNQEQDWLDLFMDNQELELYFEIWTIDGVLIQEGPARSFEVIKLLTGAKGIHFLKLYSRDKSKYYGRRLFIRN